MNTTKLSALCGMYFAFVVALASAASTQVAVPGGGGGQSSKKNAGIRPSNVQPLSAELLLHAGLSVMLGRPSGDSITLNLLGDRDQDVVVEYGLSEATLSVRTEPLRLATGKPAEVTLAGLESDREYRYRLFARTREAQEYVPGPEGRFRTARTPGTEFTFEVIGDSHPERQQQFNSALYLQNLAASAASRPDLFLTIGDDFSVDTLPEFTQAAIDGIYRRQRLLLSVIGSVAPVFLVNGNHEQASLANYDGTGENVASWAQNARNAYFPQPAPNGFYSGDTEPLDGIGLLRDYYSFTWGDALFVVIDHYWHSPEAVDNALGGREKTRDLWKTTLGQEQYDWFRKTLEGSHARWKFVFAHHVSGTGRGGVERAPYFEWGGRSADGSLDFESERPGWPAPIHELMSRNGVTAFIQGHDHVFANQTLDNVAYITLPEPADPNYGLYNAAAFRSGDVVPNSGRVRFRVGSSGVLVEYIREWLPGDGPQGSEEGSAVAYRFEIPPGSGSHSGAAERNPGMVGSPDAKSTTERGRVPAGPAPAGSDWKLAAPGRGGTKGVAALESAPAPKAVPAGTDSPRTARGKGSKAAGASLGTQGAAPYPEFAGSLDGMTLVEYPGATSVTLATAFLEEADYRYEYREADRGLDRSTPMRRATAGSVARETISSLEPGRSYIFRLAWILRGSGTWRYSEPGRFSTQKPAGTPFTFVVEADPHLDENSDGSVYRSALARMAADSPDFAVDLGDTSMVEKLGKDREGYLERNRLVRSYWDEIGATVPFLMVVGNHDGEHGWSPRGNQPTSAEAAAIRKTWLLDTARAPADSYETFGDTAFALEWGDALLVALDPYSAEAEKPGEDGWSWTLGKAQYDWLSGILERSEAAYRFVFIHNMLGGLGGEARGGANYAEYFEWGGLDPDGSTRFASRRPGWAEPLHDLFVRYGVDAVFRGHDHFYAREEKDGIVYQLVPQPSLGRGGQTDTGKAAAYGYTDGVFLSEPGYLRVSVSAGRALVEYVGAIDGAVVDSYALDPR